MSAFESWCIVELMGHQRMAGYVTEETVGGGAFIRVEVPETNARGAYTRLLNPSAIYALNPTTEILARQAAEAFQPAPIQTWELPEARRIASDIEVATDDVEREPDEVF